MPERKSPSLDLLVLCTDVVYDAQKQPFSLNEPLHTVAIEPNDEDQLAAPELMLYVQMTDEDAQGTYRLRAEVRTETNVVLPELRSEGIDVTFASRYYPVRPFEHVFVPAGWCSPAPGSIIFM